MVYNLVETKQIPAIRLGRLVRIRKSDLNDALRRLGNR
jgi:excisionase family DNA binding protein